MVTLVLICNPHNWSIMFHTARNLIYSTFLYNLKTRIETENLERTNKMSNFYIRVHVLCVWICTCLKLTNLSNSIVSVLLASLQPSCPQFSYQIELFQVVSEDGVLDDHKDEADVFCVCGAGEVRVQLLVLVRVLFLVHFQDELLGRFRILLRSCNSKSVLFQRVGKSFVL